MNKKQLNKELKKAKAQLEECFVTLDYEHTIWGLHHNAINNISSMLITDFDYQTKVRQISGRLHQLTVELAKERGVRHYLLGDAAK